MREIAVAPIAPRYHHWGVVAFGEIASCVKLYLFRPPGGLSSDCRPTNEMVVEEPPPVFSSVQFHVEANLKFGLAEAIGFDARQLVL